MVQIKQNNGLQGESIISAACTVGVMLCLVVTVLGIKFKWFKHRLTFSQTPSPNTRETASSSSAYPNDGNFMQGVFRCRDAESEDIERPKTLPPIRIRKTSSKTPRYSLPPPKKHNEVVSQEPPPPPPPPLPSITTPPIADVPKTKKPKTPQTKQRKARPKPAANDTEARTTTEAINNPKVALNKKVNFGNDSVEEIPSKPDRGKHFEKLKTERTSSNSFTTKQAPPRRPTGFVRPQVDELDIPENHDIAERRPTGYVRPQIDDFTELDQSISVENSQDRIQTNSDSKIILKLDGFSDSEEKSEPVFEKIKNIPKPEPRSTIPQQIGILGSNQNEDAWSAVQRHRNLTQEIAQHHIAVNMRAQIQNDEEALAVKDSPKNEKPRTMRDMRKSQAQASSKKERTIDGCNEDEAEA